MQLSVMNTVRTVEFTMLYKQGNSNWCITENEAG